MTVATPPLASRIESWAAEASRHRGTKRWGRYGDEVLDMSVAEMDFPTAEPVMHAIQDAVARQGFGYPLTEEFTDFQDASARWLSEGGLHLDPENVFMLAHVAQGLVLSLQHLVPRNGPVAVITPAYSSFFSAIELAGRTVREVAMVNGDEGYELDLRALEAALDEGASCILLCNPNNPTGTVYREPELTALAELAHRWSVRVITDEVHAPLTFGPANFRPFASVSRQAAEVAVTLTSASKAWNIPGLRCAIVGFSRPEDAAVWRRLSGAARGGISPLGVAATIAAVSQGQAWLSVVKEMLVRKRDLLAHGLNSLGHGRLVAEGGATYLGWVDLRQFDATDHADELRRHSNVLVLNGTAHGQAGAGYVRVNYASADSVIDEFLERLEQALTRWKRAPPTHSNRIETPPPSREGAMSDDLVNHHQPD